MTELQNKTAKFVQIDGDKSYFNSKSAIDKFKNFIKTNENYDLNELSTKYLKEGFKLVQLNKMDDGYKFRIEQKETKKEDDNTKTRDILRARLYNMKQMRTNGFYHKAKNSANVPDDILCEYKKLIKISNVPIPEPSEILANPEQYKSVVSIVLNNNMMKTLPKTHPYVKYFKLIAKELGLDNILPIPTQSFLNNENMKLPDNLEQLINMSGPTNVKGNEMSHTENDTDSETEPESNSNSIEI